MTERRTFSAEFKAKVVLEMIRGEKGLMQASREYQIKDTVLSRWKQEFLERAPELFKAESQQQGGSGDKERIEELERMVGKMTMELDVAKKVLNGTSLVSPGRKRS
jgi:transposase